MRIMPFAALCGALLCDGCANLNSIERTEKIPTRDAGTGTVLMVDAKQRVIYTVSKPGATPQSERIPVYCAEPSPDALSAIAANGGLSLSKKDVASLTGNVGTAEEAAAIGLRTQSIQLMRDIMFRECEAYVNGANKDLAFMTEHRRLQSSMVAILAIEQLTGAIKAEQPVLTGLTLPSGTGNGDQAGKKSDDQGDDSGGGGKKSDDATTKKAAMAQTLSEDIAKQNDLEKKVLASVDGGKGTGDDKKLKDAKAKTSSDADKTKKIAKSDPTKQSKPTQDEAKATKTDAMAYVAPAVDDIVTQAINLSFTRELCTSVLEGDATHPYRAKGDPTTVGEACFQYLVASTDALNKQATSCEALHTALADLMRSSDTSKVDIGAIGKLYDSMCKKQQPGTLMEESFQ